MSMIFHPVLEETVMLANKNMILKNRGGFNSCHECL